MEMGGKRARERERERERERVCTFNMPFSGFFRAFGASVSSCDLVLSRDSEENQINLNHKINQ